jgi:hypothetical protein
MARRNVEKTTLDEDVTAPSTTAPGDGPADTTDPTERAVSVTPNPGDDALKVGTVNAVKPAPRQAEVESTAKPRVEKYEATKPDGSTVTVERNVETGESKVS